MILSRRLISRSRASLASRASFTARAGDRFESSRSTPIRDKSSLFISARQKVEARARWMIARRPDDDVSTVSEYTKLCARNLASAGGRFRFTAAAVAMNRSLRGRAKEKREGKGKKKKKTTENTRYKVPRRSAPVNDRTSSRRVVPGGRIEFVTREGRDKRCAEKIRRRGPRTPRKK